jgi:hypothetical protein
MTVAGGVNAARDRAPAGSQYTGNLAGAPGGSARGRYARSSGRLGRRGLWERGGRRGFLLVCGREQELDGQAGGDVGQGAVDGAAQAMLQPVLGVGVGNGDAQGVAGALEQVGAGQPAVEGGGVHLELQLVEDGGPDGRRTTDDRRRRFDRRRRMVDDR